MEKVRKNVYRQNTKTTQKHPTTFRHFTTHPADVIDFCQIVRARARRVCWTYIQRIYKVIADDYLAQQSRKQTKRSNTNNMCTIIRRLLCKTCKEPSKLRNQIEHNLFHLRAATTTEQIRQANGQNPDNNLNFLCSRECSISKIGKKPDSFRSQVGTISDQPAQKCSENFPCAGTFLEHFWNVYGRKSAEFFYQCNK